jgi:hypothetical protein
MKKLRRKTYHASPLIHCLFCGRYKFSYNSVQAARLIECDAQKICLASFRVSTNDLAARLQWTPMLTAYRYHMAGLRRNPLSRDPPSRAFSILVFFREFR